MAILLPKDTNTALGTDAKACKSRSLLFDRFTDPGAREETRQAWFKRVSHLEPHSAKRVSWSRWLGEAGLDLEPNAILFARLQSRLMVNMAGGVMENAGLCLDRFGVPYIPGAAVKGCARRRAIQSLLEVRENNEPTEALACFLTDIARIFGWGEQDWSEDKDKRGRFMSDFAYAIGEVQWPGVVISVGRQLLGKEPRSAKDFGHFAGAISFLPAFPCQLPPNDLELDILTCHHPCYYAQTKDRSGGLLMPVALDTEKPNPVVFLAVAAGTVFQFATLPLRVQWASFAQQGKTLREIACEQLRQGLEAFGLGAKTAAGYGWFDASESFNQRFLAEQRQEAEAEAKRLKAEREAAEIKAREQAQKEERERQRGSLAPDDAWMREFKGYPETKRREVINKFAFEDEKWWPAQGELSDERVQFTLLHFMVNVEPEFLAADRANSRSKTAKALAGLRRKFPKACGSS